MKPAAIPVLRRVMPKRTLLQGAPYTPADKHMKRGTAPEYLNGNNGLQVPSPRNKS